MSLAVFTFQVPSFNYRSPWWWCLDQIDDESVGFDLVGPSDEHQFQRKQFQNGMAHLLNVYADPETDWDERERTEFAVKAYVYLSKLSSFDRIVVADCAGIEPLLVSNLSILAPVWVKMPIEGNCKRGQQGSKLLSLAERTFTYRDLLEDDTSDEWPPDVDSWTTILTKLHR